MALTVYLMEALQPLIYRRPSEIAAQAHGPAVGAASMEQPFPTGLAGALANYARLRGLCSPSSCGDTGFENLEECLRGLLGKGFHLYTGFMLDGAGEVWAPSPSRGFARLRDFPRLFMAQVQGSRIDAEVLEPPRRQRVGIALNPSTKTVRRGMLYVMEEQLPPETLQPALLVSAPNAETLPGSLPSLLGSKGRMVVLRRSSSGVESVAELLVHGGDGCGRWLLALASPALLDWSPWEEVVELTDGRAVRSLAGSLLAGTPIEPGRVSAVLVPKRAPGLEVIAPGWCTPEGRPRRPYLHVPPGTMLLVEADRGSIEKAVERGLGLYTELGWGTVAAVCVEDAGAGKE